MATIKQIETFVGALRSQLEKQLSDAGSDPHWCLDRQEIQAVFALYEMQEHLSQVRWGNSDMDLIDDLEYLDIGHLRMLVQAMDILEN